MSRLWRMHIGQLWRMVSESVATVTDKIISILLLRIVDTAARFWTGGSMYDDAVPQMR